MINNISFQPNMIYKENLEYKSTERELSIYLHFPFCNSLCAYCGIGILNNNNKELLESYLVAIKKEINNKEYLWKECVVKSVHIGGGTPSLMTEKQIGDLISFLNYRFGSNFELIFEAHPQTLTKEKIDAIYAYDKTSLNIGIQSFDESVLSFVDRYNDIDRKLSIIRYAIANRKMSVGVDLICGLPNSNYQIFLEDIYKAISLGVDHLAIYPLWKEKNSIINKKKDIYNNKLWNIQNVETALDSCYEILQHRKYKRYSIFHFSSKDEATHIYGRNQMEGKEWLGIGAGAVSYFNNTIFLNTKSIKDYIIYTDEKNVSNNYLNDSAKILRDFTYHLRLVPFDLEKYRLDKGDFIYAQLKQKLDILHEKNWINIEGERACLTAKGICKLGEIEGFIMSEGGNE